MILTVDSCLNEARKLLTTFLRPIKCFLVCSFVCFFLTTNKTSGVCVSVRIHSQNKTDDGKCSALLETHRRCHLHEADEMPRVCEAESKATGVIKI